MRVRKRVLDEGIKHFQPHEILELLLFPFVPRKDTNGLAHTLMDTFGSLSGVLRASQKDLNDIPNMPTMAAFYFNVYYELADRIKKDDYGSKVFLSDSEKSTRYLIDIIGNKPQEVVVALCLNAKLKLVRSEELATGNCTEARLNMRKLASVALSPDIAYIVLGHNHPSDNLTPSIEDIDFTNEASSFLMALGVRLVDHIIVTMKSGISLSRGEVHLPCFTASANYFKGVADKQIEWK